MDRIKVSGTFDRGSNPLKGIKLNFVIFFKKQKNFFAGQRALASGGGAERQSSQSGFSSKKVWILTKRYRQFSEFGFWAIVASPSLRSGSASATILKGFLKLRKNTMPRRFAPRLFLTISQKVKIGGGGGIRTHETLAGRGFRDRSVKPLRYPSLQNYDNG